MKSKKVLIAVFAVILIAGLVLGGHREAMAFTSFQVTMVDEDNNRLDGLTLIIKFTDNNGLQTGDEVQMDGIGNGVYVAQPNNINPFATHWQIRFTDTDYFGPVNPDTNPTPSIVFIWFMNNNFGNWVLYPLPRR